ncbi:TLDc domain-containing protein [Entamoeba marina]
MGNGPSKPKSSKKQLLPAHSKKSFNKKKTKHTSPKHSNTFDTSFKYGSSMSFNTLTDVDGIMDEDPFIRATLKTKQSKKSLPNSTSLIEKVTLEERNDEAKQKTAKHLSFIPLRKKYSVLESQFQNETNIIQPEQKQSIEIISPKSFVHELEVIHKKNCSYKVIYSIETNLFDSRELFSIIHSVKNVIFLFVTEENHIFGSFHHIMPKKRGKWLKTDNEHYIFTLRNPSGVPPTRYQWRIGGNNILFFAGEDNSEQMVCAITKFISVWKNGSWIIDTGSDIWKSYDGDFLSNKLFTGSCFPNKFNLEHFLIVQVTDN